MWIGWREREVQKNFIESLQKQAGLARVLDVTFVRDDKDEESCWRRSAVYRPCFHDIYTYMCQAVVPPEE